MRKNIQITFVLALTLSMLLGACTSLPSPIVTSNAPTQAAPPTAVNTSQTGTPAAVNTSPTGTSAAVNPTPTATPDALLLPSQDVLALFTKLVDSIPATQGYGYIQPDALKADLAYPDKPFLLDVRDAAEVNNNGYIVGAVNIPLRLLLTNLDKLPGVDSNIVIYSNSGYRSGMALAALTLIGFTNVHDLAGGVSSWIHASQFPVVTGIIPAAPEVLTSKPVVTDRAVYNMLDAFLSNLPNDYYQITATQLSAELTSSTPPTLIDMNTANDHLQYGYIKGSVNIPFSDFFKSVDKLPAKDTPIVIYAVGGGHSSILIMGLREMGYTNVLNLEGGIIGWKDANLPVQIGNNN